MERVRQEVLTQQALDVQQCRTFGGVPVTEHSDAAYSYEFRVKLTRCEFPCDKRSLQGEK